MLVYWLIISVLEHVLRRIGWWFEESYERWKANNNRGVVKFQAMVDVNDIVIQFCLNFFSLFLSLPLSFFFLMKRSMTCVKYFAWKTSYMSNEFITQCSILCYKRFCPSLNYLVVRLNLFLKWRWKKLSICLRLVSCLFLDQWGEFLTDGLCMVGLKYWRALLKCMLQKGLSCFRERVLILSLCWILWCWTIERDCY